MTKIMKNKYIIRKYHNKQNYWLCTCPTLVALKKELKSKSVINFDPYMTRFTIEVNGTKIYDWYTVPYYWSKLYKDMKPYIK